jgi:hypothetical protein
MALGLPCPFQHFRVWVKKETLEINLHDGWYVLGITLAFIRATFFQKLPAIIMFPHRH